MAIGKPVSYLHVFITLAHTLTGLPYFLFFSKFLSLPTKIQFLEHMPRTNEILNLMQKYLLIIDVLFTLPDLDRYIIVLIGNKNG